MHDDARVSDARGVAVIYAGAALRCPVVYNPPYHRATSDFKNFSSYPISSLKAGSKYGSK